MGSTPGAPKKRAGRATVVAARLVERLGGRYSTEIGIAVDAGDPEVERWFVAATLFGSRISSSVAARTFHILDDAGMVAVVNARRFSWEELVALLDSGGYARYDYRMATRFYTLADVVRDHYGGRVAYLGRRFPDYPALRLALDDLPGWGPVTVQLFLRELRGVWPGAQPPLDERTEMAAFHLGLVDPRQAHPTLSHFSRLAARAQLDPRDLESGLVRLALTHHDRWERCPGGAGCAALASSAAG